MPIRRANIDLKDGIDAGISGIVQYKWYKPPVGATNYIVTSFEPTVGTGTSCTLAAQNLDNGVTQYARNVTATLTDANASITSLVVHVYGRDKWKNRVYEKITCAAGSTVAGSQMFSYIDAVKYDCAGTVTGGADTLVVGTGAKLALPVKVGASTDIIRCLKHATDVDTDAAPVVETVAALDTTYHSITMTTTLAAANWDFSVEILSTYGLPSHLVRT